jgi:DamX protein
MSAQAHAIEYNAPQSVTTISANARVDYILRFSKHAVLVVDQDANVYSQVASQFLGSLGNDHNAAFIAVSPKLNDIQIRCRIVEQLFADTLFDPEQSLAVSVINLAKQEKQMIDIVIEHAQFLSVQILHELCQLTEIAKKANYAISVLMLGTPQAGLTLAKNKSLFHKKISVLSGQTGQLLTLSSKAFKVNSSFFKFNRFTKWTMAFIGFVICLAFTGYWLFQQDVFSENTKLKLQEVTSNSTSIISAYSKKNLSTSAEVEDIFISLTANEKTVKERTSVPAKPADIVKAIVNSASTATELIAPKLINKAKRFESFLDKNPKNQNKIVPKLTLVAAVSGDVLSKTPKSNVGLIESVGAKANYYKSVQTGFVIQIAGFTRLSVYQEFVPDFKDINIKSYYRLFNQQTMLMITSEVFKTRLAAEKAVNLLPSTIQVHQPWVKSVEAINNEINAYQRSQ